MAVVSAANGTQAATINTEHSLTQQTGIGIYVLVVETTNMALGDILEIYIKTKSNSGQSSQKAYKYLYSDAQNEPNKYSVPVPVDTEIACTLKQTAGTGRSYVWNLLRA